ncbi:Pentatricopeptide repeat [Macleaya cordata]|uniref:Pentatricopeptide repeat n=1 Tax=Macleaya cordata TaxID=56857 RepID=A0A200PTZ4_MACCD|nr:Pentatricopeptide repeat [Macleaya cordata]
MLQRLRTKRWTNSSSSLYTCNRRANHLSTSAAVSGDQNGVFTESKSPKISTNWVSDNKLFQKFPRLSLLEGEKCKSLNQLNQLLSYIFVSGLHRNPFVMSRVIYTCVTGLENEEDSEFKRNYGALIFSQIQKPNIFTWNTMIRAFSILGNSSESIIAFQYYVEMLRKGFLPDKYTYPFLLQVCGSNSDLGFEKQVHSHAVVFGFITDLFVQNGLLNAYLVSGYVIDARKLFDEMTERDVVSWTTLISGFLGQGFYEECLLVFTEMMGDEFSVQPNVATVVSVMAACANLGSLDHTWSLHSYLEKSGWVEVDVSVRNSLIDAYSKCGSINCAGQIFHEIQFHRRDTCSWTAIIAGLAMHGFGKEAILFFSQMKRVELVPPDSITFIAVLSACAHAGLVDEGVQIFESMETEYGILPELKHYGCMVDLFGRAGLLEYAYNFMEKMPMEPNLAILGSLLSACRVHDNVKLGEAVLKKIELSCEYRGGSHVLISNMYANKNQWCEVVHVREGFRAEKRNGKPPGRSWIQVKGLVHESGASVSRLWDYGGMN